MTLRLRQTTLLLIAPVILAATLAGCARTEMDMASRPSDPEQDRTPSEVEVEGEDSSEPRTPTPSGSLTAASEPAPAATQSDSLTLTLTAAAACETEAGRGGFWERVRIDADGNRTYEHVALGLYGVAETPVQWSVTGGTAPFTLVIDGEARDARHEYKGRRGTASVSCALETGDVYFGPDTPGREVRRYRGAAVVDSGLKTIRAVVTDGEGRTAETSIDVYVIRTDPEILRRGQTYRVWGDLLVTAPSSYDVALGSPLEIECEERDDPDPYYCEPSFGLDLLPDGHHGDWTTAVASINLYVLDGTEESRWRKLNEGTWIEITAAVLAASDEDDPVLAALDEIANSVGDPPRTR
ncbi:MAG: hypothetical protein OXD50_16350 [Chloroflexi bacterium]|nr:hypothetical protein [Chloroflexota bacterium]